MCIRDRDHPDWIKRKMDMRRKRAEAGPHDAEQEETITGESVSYTHLRAHETVLDLVCRLLLEKKKKQKMNIQLRSRHNNKSQ